MNFLTPLALAFAALSIPIILLYMLKLRRRDVLVSSTLLWQRLLRDREANAPWQRLRRNLLLLLQLIILSLLVLALARPYILAPKVVSGSVIVLLDASASMQARDVEPTRFDAAVRAAREIIDGLGAGDIASIIAVGPQPQTLASATGDRAFLRDALEAASPTDGPADWEAAFALASASAMGAPDTRVIIISDGAMRETLPSLPGEARFVSVGGGRDNLAITTLATREGPDGPQVFLRAANYRDADAETLVEFSADGVLFDARRLSIPAQGNADLTLTDAPYNASFLEANLKTEDALPLDDQVWAVHSPPASGQVLLVSEGNLFLERALGGLAGVDLVRLAPDQPLPEEPYALYVFDGPVTGTLPGGNLWLVGPQTSVEDGFTLRVGGAFTETAVTRVQRDAPLLRHVDVSQLHVLRARVVEPPPGARVLIESAGGPLFFVAERPAGRLAVLTFDLRDSDLPLQIAFPILTANLVNWLLPRGQATMPSVVHVGEAAPIQPAPETTTLWVTGPDGARHELPVGERQQPVFADTDRLGVYAVEQEGEFAQSAPPVAYFAVNLFDPVESNITPQDVIQIGQTEISAIDQKEEQGRREFWPWLAIAALLVLGIEWWAYYVGQGRRLRPPQWPWLKRDPAS
jgi:Ca-activated chloride channel homolog